MNFSSLTIFLSKVGKHCNKSYVWSILKALSAVDFGLKGFKLIEDEQFKECLFI